MADIKWIRKQENAVASENQRLFDKEVGKRTKELYLEKKDNIIERFEYLERKIDALFSWTVGRKTDYPMGNFKKEMKRRAEQEIIEQVQ